MKRFWFIGLLALLLPLQATFAQNDRLQVVASFSIIQDVVQQVAGDLVDVDVLMEIGVDPHTFNPTPQQVAQMEDADAVFINGAYFEEGLMDIITAQGDNINTVVLSDCVFIWGTSHEHEGEAEEADDHEHELVDIPEECAAYYAELEVLHGGHLPHYFEETMGILHTLDCARDEHEDEEAEDDDHEHGACDPHVWMDPHNVILWTYLIRDTLSELDPANAEAYAANAAAYAAQLDELVHTGFAMLASIPQENRVLITSHQTFSYMTNPIGFEVTESVIPGGSTISEIDPSSFADLIDVVESTGVSAVFAENTVNPRLVEQLSDEADVTLRVLYTDSLSEAAATYIEYMQHNYTTITDALGGDVNATPEDE